MSSEGELGNVGEPSVSLTTDPLWGDRVTTGPGVTGSFLLATSPSGTPQTTEAGKVSGSERHAKRPERGTVAVVAAQSTGEGGEVRPKRPTGGKAPSGSASTGGTQGRDIELTNPGHRTPGDCKRAAAALLEEPYACIAHVRVCGGAGWETTGSTRQATASSLRCAAVVHAASPS